MRAISLHKSSAQYKQLQPVPASRAPPSDLVTSGGKSTFRDGKFDWLRWEVCFPLTRIPLHFRHLLYLSGGFPFKKGYPLTKRGVPRTKRGAHLFKWGTPRPKWGAHLFRGSAPPAKSGGHLLKRGAPPPKRGAPRRKRFVPRDKRGAHLRKRFPHFFKVTLTLKGREWTVSIARFSAMTAEFFVTLERFYVAENLAKTADRTASTLL